MNLRITANYAATDGSVPESVAVVWDDLEVGNHPSGEDIKDIIGCLVAHAVVSRSTYSETVPAGRKYRAGVDLLAGTRIAASGNGFTLYPAGHPLGDAEVGTVIEGIPSGSAMSWSMALNGSGRIWIKETT